jgi:hypothetical protein
MSACERSRVKISTSGSSGAAASGADSVPGQSETSALALGVAASTPKPDIRPRRKGVDLATRITEGIVDRFR